MTSSVNMNSCFEEPIAHGIPNRSPYSQEQLPCHGRGCAQCGKCRDWSWTVGTNSCYGVGKVYMKRADATCTACYGGAYDNQYDCDCCFGDGSYYHYFFGCCFFGRHCECNDNSF